MSELTPEQIEAGREFHAEVQRIMGLSDEDYAEFRQIVARRLEGEPHVHTRFCGHVVEPPEGKT